MRFILFFTTSICFLISCTKEIEINLPQHDTNIVVDGTIETNRHPIVLISKSADIYSSTDIDTYLSNFILDAEVKVVCNQDTTTLNLYAISDLPIDSQKKLAEMLRLKDLDELQFLPPLMVYSSSDISGNINQTYKLIIKYNEKYYSGETKIENPIPLDVLYWKGELENNNYGYGWALLSDPSNQFNAYKWEVKRTNLNSEGISIDNIFRSAKGWFFDDKYSDGLSFEFSFKNPLKRKDTTHLKEYRRYYRFGDTVVIKFSRMDESVYEFLEKKYTQLTTVGSPFSTPINIPSNMNGGALGIWAGYSPVYDTLYCYP